MSLLALIPARGGSKGISRKNIRELCGKPLIAWSIEAAQNSVSVDKIVVSTEDEEIADIARFFGADVPFFIRGGLQVGDGIGEKLTQIKGCMPGIYLLVVPDFYIDTSWAYKNYNFFLDSSVEQVNFAGFLERDGVPFELFENDFEEIVVPTYPEIGEIKDSLRANGARFASLSGSGSTVYGIFDDEADALSAESPLTTSYSTFITGPHL